ncbi:MAG: gamma subclass chorismate mutase AroQ [Gemmataceae bacterium]
MTLLYLSFLLTVGCREAPPPTTPAPPIDNGKVAARTVDQLLLLMKQRLLLMHEVARWKWTNGIPIQDTEREARVLQAVEIKARNRGLNTALVKRFFTAQLEAAKMIQEEDFAAWTKTGQGPFPNTEDLGKSLRPRIDTLNDALILSLDALESLRQRGEIHNDLIQERAARELTSAGITEAVRQRALEPLLKK